MRDRLVFWSALADDQERPWTIRGADKPAAVPLARTDLAAALDALLGNVFRYTPEGTRFAVTLVHQADLVALVVEDAGPGIRTPNARCGAGPAVAVPPGWGSTSPAGSRKTREVRSTSTAGHLVAHACN